MSDCTHNCSTCGQDCASRTEESLLAKLNPKSKVRIHEKGWSGLTLTFRKDGYGMERKFDINILDEDKSKLTMRQDVQVKMPVRK